MGESALIDRETGRVFWEGGASTTLTESIFATKLDQFGAEHAHATLLTAFITIAFLGILAGWLRRIVNSLPSIVTDESSSKLINSLQLLLSYTLFRIPHPDNKWLVVLTVALYLLESYNCNTRRFLANAIVSPTEVEQYIEDLRSQEPIVTWMVRSFHYRKRRIFALTEVFQTLIRKLKPHSADEAYPNLPTSHKCSPAFPFTKKVITHEAKTTFRYNSSKDNTIAGLWKRADSTSSSLAPFTKLMLSKLLVLNDSQTRQEYFRQQSEFVTEHGRGDEFTEFSTDIQVPGYRPRMLAVRSIKGISSARIFRLHLFWFFTFCGLTVPYRIWFKRHCDSLRVIVVKETSAVPPSTSYWDNARQWIPYTISPTSTVKPHDTHFRNFMKGRFLYGDESTTTTIPSLPSSTTTAPDTSQFMTSDKPQSTPVSPVSDQ